MADQRSAVSLRTSERCPDAYSNDPPRRESLHVPYGVGAEHTCRAIVWIPVDQKRRENDEAASILAEELRMVERVVEQRRQLQPETVVSNDILVNREVHDPGSW